MMTSGTSTVDLSCQLCGKETPTRYLLSVYSPGDPKAGTSGYRQLLICPKCYEERKERTSEITITPTWLSNIHWRCGGE